MKRNYLILIFSLTCFLGTAQVNQTAESLDSVFIDTKVPLERKNSGKVVVTITAEQLEQSAGKTTAQIINEVSGIEINGSRSHAGQNLSYYVRGGRNRQVVIMVDGVQLTDPSQISNDYDLRLIPAHTIESIEIIKGASSVLYGSGAATAVISINTKKASQKPIAATFISTLGTNRSSEDKENFHIAEFTNFATVNGTLNKFFYNASFSNRYVDGISAVAAPEGEDPFESDVFDRFDGRVDLGYRISEDITISQFFAFGKFKAGFDDFSYTDANHQSLTKQLRTGGHFEWKYKNGVYVFNDNYSWIEREIKSGFPAKFDSRSYALDTYLNHRIIKNFNVVLGLNFTNSNFNSFTIPFGATQFSQDVEEDTAKFNSADPYVNLVYISNFGLNLNAGARLNLHSVYDSHWVYNFNPSYVFEFSENNLKLLGSYSTAYITPSLFQLYDPLYGNEALLPEENRTIEGGLEFSSEDFRISAVYFNRNEENFVDFVVIDPDTFRSQYQNISETFEASGVEVALWRKFGERVTFSSNYTNTQADDRFALRIPEHKINATLGYQLGSKTSVGVNYQYNSERNDTFFNPQTFVSEDILLSSYGVLDLRLSHQATDTIKLFAGVTNLLDEEYEELYRYQTLGRNVRLGFALDF
ncbi:TonB-dependent receptor plug domain-containing protein [Constantimarinum furrinae]|uniref:TonB-dependent receptor plug n=1 Tax=Constantimarinum furrinae TaxID=2562285 RepID=A0A7G8PW10_9FLAO|nr:TonB-dependent receptor [Constantimarinum furrinae]QNJ98526.1 TonB-dependent receptor plug [Constantimarinum furrinae]